MTTVAKPPRHPDAYQEQVAARFAAGESAAELQAAYGIDDGDLMGSLRDVLRRLLGDSGKEETVVPAVPVAVESTLADDLRRIRWGGMNPESPFYDTHIAAAYKRVVAAVQSRARHQREKAEEPVAVEPLPTNPVEPETTRGQLQWGLDCVAGALGRPSLLVGEHAGAVSKVMSERDAALAQVEQLKSELQRVYTTNSDNAQLLEQERAHSTALRAEVEQLTKALETEKLNYLRRDRELADCRGEWSKQERRLVESKTQVGDALIAANERAARLEALLADQTKEYAAAWLEGWTYAKCKPDSQGVECPYGTPHDAALGAERTLNALIRARRAELGAATGERAIVAQSNKAAESLYYVTPQRLSNVSPEPGVDRIVFVINGEDVSIDVPFPDRVTLVELVRFALRESRNTSRPFTDWEVRSVTGRMVTDLQCTVASFNAPLPLFLTVAIGAGGADAASSPPTPATGGEGEA